MRILGDRYFAQCQAFKESQIEGLLQRLLQRVPNSLHERITRTLSVGLLKTA